MAKKGGISLPQIAVTEKRPRGRPRKPDALTNTVPIVNGRGLYERCAPQMFGVFAIEQPPRAGQLPVLRLLAVDVTQAAARAAAAARV